MSKPHVPDRSDDQYRPIELPTATAQAIATRIEATDFESVDEYVAVAMQQLLREFERREDDDHTEASTERAELAPGDDVSDRLESLGYR
jgi:Arc/MetJ-type ribon-helix-helix transcriptional regulator